MDAQVFIRQGNACILSFHALTNAVRRSRPRRSNLDAIDMFDDGIVDIYSENRKTKAADTPSISLDE